MNDATKTIEETRERQKYEIMLRAQSDFCAKITRALRIAAKMADPNGPDEKEAYFERLAGEFDYEFRSLLLQHGEMVTAPLMRALTEAAGMGYMMAEKMQNADKKQS